MSGNLSVAHSLFYPSYFTLFSFSFFYLSKEFYLFKQMLFYTFCRLSVSSKASSSTQALNLRLNWSKRRICSIPLTHCLWRKYRKVFWCDDCTFNLFKPTILFKARSHVKNKADPSVKHQLRLPSDSFRAVCSETRGPLASVLQLVTVPRPYFNMSVQICCLLFLLSNCFPVEGWSSKCVGEEIYTLPQLLFGK